ncbi:MAG: DUF4846 domain-containing protein [Bacteroidota bacterium]
MCKKPLHCVLSLALAFFISCSPSSRSEPEEKQQPQDASFEIASSDMENDLVLPSGSTIASMIKPPDDYKRLSVLSNSFGEYLRNLPVKPSGSKVKHHDGVLKSNQNVHVAVIDMEIGSKDLHQCADAVMRLRAEYLWKRGLYSQIHFNFTSGFRFDYSKWKEGYRIQMEGNKATWVKKSNPSNTYADFWKYMEMVFSYAGTASLEKELKPVDLADMQIGDLFIKGGFPGHAVVVVDMAVHESTGEKLFLLAQSYMPAQETHVLKNPIDAGLSPWCALDFDGELTTPEWTFGRQQLKRFE